jgi:hypothetical protein
MSKESIVAAIDAEIGRLEKAKTLLASYDGAAPKRAAKQAAKRKLSPEARKRIADAQKRRWAAMKKSQWGAFTVR